MITLSVFVGYLIYIGICVNCNNTNGGSITPTTSETIYCDNNCESCVINCVHNNGCNDGNINIISAANETIIKCHGNNACQGIKVFIGDINQMNVNLGLYPVSDFYQTSYKATVECFGDKSCNNSYYQFHGSFPDGIIFNADGNNDTNNMDIFITLNDEQRFDLICSEYIGHCNSVNMTCSNGVCGKIIRSISTEYNQTTSINIPTNMPTIMPSNNDVTLIVGEDKSKSENPVGFKGFIAKLNEHLYLVIFITVVLVGCISCLCLFIVFRKLTNIKKELKVLKSPTNGSPIHHTFPISERIRSASTVENDNPLNKSLEIAIERRHIDDNNHDNISMNHSQLMMPANNKMDNSWMLGEHKQSKKQHNNKPKLYHNNSNNNVNMNHNNNTHNNGNNNTQVFIQNGGFMRPKSVNAYQQQQQMNNNNVRTSEIYNQQQNNILQLTDTPSISMVQNNSNNHTPINVYTPQQIQQNMNFMHMTFKAAMTPHQMYPQMIPQYSNQQQHQHQQAIFSPAFKHVQPQQQQQQRIQQIYQHKLPQLKLSPIPSSIPPGPPELAVGNYSQSKKNIYKNNIKNTKLNSPTDTTTTFTTNIETSKANSNSSSSSSSTESTTDSSQESETLTIQTRKRNHKNRQINKSEITMDGTVIINENIDDCVNNMVQEAESPLVNDDDSGEIIYSDNITVDKDGIDIQDERYL